MICFALFRWTYGYDDRNMDNTVVNETGNDNDNENENNNQDNDIDVDDDDLDKCMQELATMQTVTKCRTTRKQARQTTPMAAT